MRFITIITFAVAGRLVALATAKPIPIPNWKAGEMAIPLTRHSSPSNSNKSVDLDAMSSHAISVRGKILRGLDNYEMNTGMMHPFAVKRSKSELRTRGTGVQLTAFEEHTWVAEISIGTPPKTLKVQIDTGAADLWVLETGCSGISADRNLWDPKASASAKKQEQTFELQYMDETIVKGDRYTDNVTIGGFTADPQTFGSVTSYTSLLSDNSNADGLMGLAFPFLAKFDASPLFTSLVEQKKVVNPTFSLKLSSTGAEMYIGGVNSMLYRGDITYTPVISIIDRGYWLVMMDDVRANGNKIITSSMPVFFDTGTSFISGDAKRVSELYSRIGGTLKKHNGIDFYYIPCDSFPTLSLTFSGKSFEIPPDVLRREPIEEGSSNCFSAIYARADLDGLPFWNIGLTFLQSVYSVFDYGTPQVGLANLA